ncbi:M48 family metalloprotease [Candidatus Dependentiae bacterium]|nr:M48 family metalloprotease [Candidatus Dependentiae bacterium]
MLQQQIIGFIRLSLPIILFFYIFPELLTNFFVQLIVSVCMGIYIWYLSYVQTAALENGLLYTPSGEHREMFRSYITLCNVDPSKIIIKYAYTAQQIAMAIGKTIVIDSTTCSICSGDANVTPIINIFHQLYESKLNDLGKKRQVWQSQNLTPGIQSFIFKHELGHVIDHYSYKKLWVIFLTGALTVFAGITVVNMILFFTNPLLAILIGLIVGMFIDIVLTLFFNLVFKTAAEKRADKFAAKYSTAEEIIQAAHFFAQEQDIIEMYKDPNNWFLKLPTTIYSGHPQGKDRKEYLLKLAKNKPTTT